MGNKIKRTPTEKLRLIGKLQLGSYLFILGWILSLELIMKFAWPDGYGYTDGRPPFLWMPFAALGTLLIPSAITFIQTGKRPKSPSTRSARILQTILFAIVLALTWPAFVWMFINFGDNVPLDYLRLLSLLLNPSLFVACVLGIISFPIMWNVTRSLVPKKIKVPVDENQNLIKQ
jgi:hypothetical protein